MKTLLLFGFALLLVFSLLPGCSEDEDDPYAKYYADDPGSQEITRENRDRAVSEYEEFLGETGIEQPTGDSYDDVGAAPEMTDGYGYDYEDGGAGVTALAGAEMAEAERLLGDMAEEDFGPAGDEIEPDITTEAETLDLERKLIFETSMTIVVDDLDDGREKVEEIIKANHKEGSTPVFITQQKVDREIGRVGRIYYTIRCHADVRDRVVKALREVGEVWAEDSTIEDVTRRYYDLEKQRDLLEADYAIAKAAFEEAEARGARSSELEALKADMERIAEALGETKGELLGFDDLITLPTIYLTIEEEDPATSYSGWRVVEEGFTVAYKAIVNILKFVIIIVGVGLLVALLFLPAFFVLRWIIRSVQRAKAKE